ncbi:hypothetical protein ACFFX0_17715 [Citricoccus parietis]|uniref:Uncharacterized protein n=1 Tax=Citricoccus parietis TaxID=592307 RepID=A0ABV5G1Y6_9MICC
MRAAGRGRDPAPGPGKADTRKDNAIPVPMAREYVHSLISELTRECPVSSG